MAKKRRSPARKAKRTSVRTTAVTSRDILHYSVAVLVAIVLILVLLKA